MSRSYNKTMGYCDRNPFMKKYFNRKIRRVSVEVEIGNGCHYRKMSDPWSICDFTMLTYSEQELRHDIWNDWCRELRWGRAHKLAESFEAYYRANVVEYKKKYFSK
ncbi:hypothetical protein D3C87_505010 [compost metagenome]